LKPVVQRLAASRRITLTALCTFTPFLLFTLLLFLDPEWSLLGCDQVHDPGFPEVRCAETAAGHALEHSFSMINQTLFLVLILPANIFDLPAWGVGVALLIIAVLAVWLCLAVAGLWRLVIAPALSKGGRQR